MLDENPNDDDIKSVAAMSSATTSRSIRTDGGGSGKKGRGALHPNHWVNKLCLWEALSTPVDGRISTQASFCVEREKKSTKNQEAAKFLQQHLTAYLLAVDLYTSENMEEKDIICALSGLYRYNKQPLPCSILLGLLAKKAKAYNECFKLIPTEETLLSYCQLLCPFVFDGDDVKCRKFYIEEPRLCAIMGLLPARKLANLFLGMAVDPIIVMIGSRCEFQSLTKYLGCLSGILEALPEDEDPHDDVFECMFEARRLINGLESLLVCDIQADTDFAKLKDLEDVFSADATDKSTAVGRISAAIYANDSLSAKHSSIKKCMSQLKLHGPTLKMHFVAMQQIQGEISLASMTVMRDAFEAFEKYKCVVPGETLMSYTTLATNKMLSIFAAFAGEKAVELEWLQQLQMTLQTAQRIMSTTDKFDSPIERVALMLRTSSCTQQETALDSACSKYAGSKGEVLGPKAGP